MKGEQAARHYYAILDVPISFHVMIASSARYDASGLLASSDASRLPFYFILYLSSISYIPLDATGRIHA
jgi:hypothetical protein